MFDRLRPLFVRHPAACVVLHDEPGRTNLGTHEVRAKDGCRTWFGGVEIKKANVSEHVIAVYAHPALLTDISPDLRRRMQGNARIRWIGAARLSR